MAHHHSACLVHHPNTTDDHNYDDIKSHFCILDAFYRTASELGVARQYLSPHLSADLFVPFFENLGIVLQNVCQSGTGLSW
jgi:hypothetical protein